MALEDISGYSLRRRLGSGSAGTVWLVRDLASGRHAVLKRIPATAADSPATLDRDLSVLKAIQHPHIARLIEVRHSGPDRLLFTQYVPAGTLTALLERRGDLSLGELVTLVNPLADALATLHQAGLHHGRLTADNIMFDADGRPVITDAALHHLAPAATPADDLTALATLTYQAGGDPTTFPAELFTQPAPTLARQVLALAPPRALNLAFERTSIATAVDSSSTAATDTAPAPTPLNATPTTTRATPTTFSTAAPTAAGNATNPSVESAAINPHPADEPLTTGSTLDPLRALTVRRFPINSSRPQSASAHPSTPRPFAHPRPALAAQPPTNDPVRPTPAEYRPTPPGLTPAEPPATASAFATESQRPTPAPHSTPAASTGQRPTPAPDSSSTTTADQRSAPTPSFPPDRLSQRHTPPFDFADAHLASETPTPASDLSRVHPAIHGPTPAFGFGGADPASETPTPASGLGDVPADPRPTPTPGFGHADPTNHRSTPASDSPNAERAREPASFLPQFSPALHPNALPPTDAVTFLAPPADAPTRPSPTGRPSRSTRHRKRSTRTSHRTPSRTPRRDTNRRAHRDTTNRLSQILAASRRVPPSRRNAYGILAMAALAAVIVLAVALTTLGVFKTPTTNPAAASPPSPTPPPAPSASTTSSSAAPPPATPVSTPTTTPAMPSAPGDRTWLQTLQSLDNRRAHAFWTLNPTELDAVYSPGSRPWTADRALLASYKSQNVRISNLRLQIQHLQQEPGPGPTITLKVTDRLISATAHTRTGQRTQLAPGPPTTRRITLTPHGKTWRITTIAPA
ncbi:serine/threonine protein kinase [Kribbella flavida DSM 17836]|uniref:Serine/threonine protein kinase n=1 Tax=Kribbella flavida (strain DSM 17836 / JCM 10339 / NBRC 14399) TaxID=479435 RepID=D2PYV8_KRIFD|nr:protein kinase [Kribbella flavida]ADB31752.1 serine/threonine protein kinase [Kribbella flavida DSM 17836]